MATRTRPDSAQAAKQKAGIDAGQGRRTGTLGRSSSSGGQSTGSMASQSSPNQLKSAQGASRIDPSKTGKKEIGIGTTKTSPSPHRRQSLDRTPPAAQMHKVISAGPRERSVTVKSPSLSSSSKTTVSRAELGRSKTVPKPMATNKAVSGSGSRSGPIAGRTLKKSSTPARSQKIESTHHISDPVEAEPENLRVIVEEEEKSRTPPQQPTIDDHGKFEDEPLLENVADIEEEEDIRNQNHHHEEDKPELVEEEEDIRNQNHHHEEDKPELVEEEEEHHESTLPVSLTNEDESSKETEVIEADEENHDDSAFQKPNETRNLEEDIHHENHNHEDESDHHPMWSNEEGEGTITESPTQQPSPLKNEVFPTEEKLSSSTNTMKAAETVSIEEPGEPIKNASLTMIKSPPKLQIKAQNSSSGKKESPVYNDVIKEAAGKLLEKRKNRVSALVGAFETVISLQEPDN